LLKTRNKNSFRNINSVVKCLYSSALSLVRLTLLGLYRMDYTGPGSIRWFLTPEAC